MPHSGGGGSHGGGSHGGGSHGGSGSGSSSRTSKTYFPGATRYRRHYYDGRDDEYFYSDAVPRKGGLSGIIILLSFAALFMAFLVPGTYKKSPQKLEENYARPASRIIDNIDIIDNDSSLEKALEEYNDITGICPVVYTMYVEDYKDSYADLETFAYVKYLELFSDERHYLFVYAIPEGQAEDFRSGALKVPDYYWESMIGDDTDALYNEHAFVRKVQKGLEAGEKPGEVFEDAIRKMSEYDKDLVSKKFRLQISGIVRFVLVLGFFVVPLVFMIRNFRKEKDFEYEAVPFTEEDMMYGRTQTQTRANTIDHATPAVKKGIRIFTIIFMIPFVLSGIGLIAGGAVMTAHKTSNGLFMLIFGIGWTVLTGAFIVPVFLATRKKPDDDDDRDDRRYDDDRWEA
ncbi:MAG: hypothetical protein K6F83_00050 [Clostridiales bacterium]|nr:hypothetical protein [Clostridiales bacterium]